MDDPTEDSALIKDLSPREQGRQRDGSRGAPAATALIVLFLVRVSTSCVCVHRRNPHCVPMYGCRRPVIPFTASQVTAVVWRIGAGGREAVVGETLLRDFTWSAEADLSFEISNGYTKRSTQVCIHCHLHPSAHQSGQGQHIHALTRSSHARPFPATVRGGEGPPVATGRQHFHG